MPRPIYGLIFLALAVGGPYLYYETSIGSRIRGIFETTSDTDTTQSNNLATKQSAWWNTANVGQSSTGSNAIPGGHFTSNHSANKAPAAQGTSIAGGATIPAVGYGESQSGTRSTSGAYRYPPIRALQEVLRFDISPEWVPQRFPQVTTVLADTQLDGMRVPLVTGTSASDMAGTLTYYFDQYKRVQRITVHAVAGDPSRFVAELQHAYQLEQQPTLGTGLYLKKWNGRATSIVYTSPAAIISADEPFARYQLFIELNQPGLGFGMSQEAQQLLATGQASRTWSR